jgi:hypothetical protein
MPKACGAIAGYQGKSRCDPAGGGVETSLTSNTYSFAERAIRLLDRAEHRCAVTPRDKELVYRTRYEAYIRSGLIQPSADERLFDESYDTSPNHFNIMTYLDGEFISTFRIHIGCGDRVVLPSAENFRDVLEPFLRSGGVVVDPTRIAAKLEMAGRLPELPYLTVRAAWLAAEHFGAETIVSTCVRDHQAFYRRVFGFKSLCLPRPYPLISRPITCMALDYRAHKANVESRYPIFCSSERERKTIFGAPEALKRRPHE